MKLQVHPHKSDLLTVTYDDLEAIKRGETLYVGALEVRLVSPDNVKDLCLSYRAGAIDHVSLGQPNLRLVFDGDTNQLKRAEVL